jgi:hypothetical protein
MTHDGWSPVRHTLLEEMTKEFDVGQLIEVNERCVELHVNDARAVAWGRLDAVMRGALDRTAWPGMNVVALDGTHVVLFEAAPFWSKRENLTKLAGSQDKRDEPRWTEAQDSAGNRWVVRMEGGRYAGIHKVKGRYIATVSYSKDGRKYTVSAGSSKNQKDAARMRDLYVLAIWLDGRLAKAPKLNFPPDTYRGIFDL